MNPYREAMPITKIDHIRAILDVFLEWVFPIAFGIFAAIIIGIGIGERVGHSTGEKFGREMAEIERGSLCKDTLLPFHAKTLPGPLNCPRADQVIHVHVQPSDGETFVACYCPDTKIKDEPR